MRKYWAIAKASLQNAWIYRADSLLWGTGELISTLALLLIWTKIFGPKQAIAGFNLPETVTYLIGVGLIANFIDTWVQYDLERDVQSGHLSVMLIRPVNYFFARLSTNFAEKPIRVFVRVVVYLAIALIFRNKFIVNQNLISIFLCLLSILFALFISFLVNFILGCAAFWTIRTRGIFGAFRPLFSIFSGGYGPLAFFPLWFQKIAYFLPFAYTRYFPMLIYLRKISGGEILKGFLVQSFWIAILCLISKYFWQKGLKRYEGVGI